MSATGVNSAWGGGTPGEEADVVADVDAKGLVEGEARAEVGRRPPPEGPAAAPEEEVGRRPWEDDMRGAALGRNVDD